MLTTIVTHNSIYEYHLVSAFMIYETGEPYSEARQHSGDKIMTKYYHNKLMILQVKLPWYILLVNQVNMIYKWYCRQGLLRYETCESRNWESLKGCSLQDWAGEWRQLTLIIVIWCGLSLSKVVWFWRSDYNTSIHHWLLSSLFLQLVPRV